MLLSTEIISQAIHNAAKGHVAKEEVQSMLANEDDYILDVASAVESGDYLNRMSYHEFNTRNSNGKTRHIEQPSLFTRVLQHLFILFIKPAYDMMDPDISFNCKEGYGISANDRSKSVSHRLKSIMYERRELHYALHIDQRQCYQHMSAALFRKRLKMLTDDKELIDFGVSVTFHGKSFPIGTPTSPLAHHIIMLDFDRWLGGITGPKIRYADDCILFFVTKEEANRAKWRIKNFWWYNYHIYSKRENSRILDIDREPISFCGLVYRRNKPDANGHNKGYVTPRKNIKQAVHGCRKDTSWASYFGLLSKTDSYFTMKQIEETMNFSDLTSKIKIERNFDAQPLPINELAKHTFTIFDFEIRYIKDKNSGNQVANWVRLLVGVPEYYENGLATNNMLRYVVKTESEAIVKFMEQVAVLCKMPNSGVLPIDGCQLENSCGYMFKGSTNREMYCSATNMYLPESSVYNTNRK
jgi:hypothetical protein